MGRKVDAKEGRSPGRFSPHEVLSASFQDLDFDTILIPDQQDFPLAMG